MFFNDLGEYLEKLENTTSRLALRDILIELFRKQDPVEAGITSYFLTGKLAPKFVPQEFNISNSLIFNIVKDYCHLGETELKQKLALKGDISNVIADCHSADKSTQRLSTKAIYEFLWEIIKIQGNGSQERKSTKILTFLKQNSRLTNKYVIRIILGKMRLGVNERTILDALAYLTEAPKENKNIIEHVFYITSDIGYTVSEVLQKDISELKNITFVPGTPIAPKLVEREASIENIFKRIENPYEEPKYDGLRCQAHVFKGEISQKHIQDRIWAKFIYQESPQVSLFNTESDIKVLLFSRNLESMTDMFPEIVQGFSAVGQKLFNEYPSATAFVFDGEVVGVNDITNEFMPFQETMRRKRKYKIADAQEQTPVKIFLFDLIFWNNTTTLDIPLNKRKEYLTKIKDVHSNILITPVHSPKTSKEATDIFYTYVEKGLEGVIFKDPASMYTIGIRNFDWIKYKKSMKKELADTIDVVILGYYYGSGRLAKLGIGALLAGIYDKENDSFLTITKIGTGLTDELWQEIKKKADEYKVNHMLPNIKIPKALMPDVLLAPGLIVEVEADEITKSPLHSSRFALRFPRFKRFRNKNAYDITTLQEIKEMWQTK